MRVSQQRKRIFAKEVDEKESEKELTKPHPPRQGFQMIFGSLAGGVFTDKPQNTLSTDDPSSSKAASAASPKGHSVNMVEPYRQPCLLNSCGSLVTQIELDELHRHFHVLHSISMRAPEMGELPQQVCKELGEIAFPKVALEYKVRLPIAPFIRKLLSEFPQHPLQVSPTLWEYCLALCVL